MDKMKSCFVLVLCFVFFASVSATAGVRAVKIPAPYSWSYEGPEGYLYYDWGLTVDDSGFLTIGMEPRAEGDVSASEPMPEGFYWGGALEVEDPEFDGFANIFFEFESNEGEVWLYALASKDWLFGESAGLSAAEAGEKIKANAVVMDGLNSGDMVPVDEEYIGDPKGCNVINLMAVLAPSGEGPGPVLDAMDVEPQTEPVLKYIHVMYNTRSGITPSKSYNVPNPFSPGSGGTNIVYEVGEAGSDIHIKIFTPSGRLVWEKRMLNVPAGNMSTAWEGVSNLGEEVASGVYVCMIIIQKPSGSQTVKTCKIVVR